MAPASISPRHVCSAAPRNVSGAPAEVALLRRFEQDAGIFRADGQRLLAENVLAGRQGSEVDLVVRARHCEVENGVHVRVGQHRLDLHSGHPVPLRDLRGTPQVKVRASHHLDTVERGQVLKVDPADRAATDNSDSHGVIPRRRGSAPQVRGARTVRPCARAPRRTKPRPRHIRGAECIQYPSGSPTCCRCRRGPRTRCRA